MCHARKERVLLFGTRSADYIRASSHNGCIQRPNTWLHPNASLKCPIFPLHRGRRPYMAHDCVRRAAPFRTRLDNNGQKSILPRDGYDVNDDPSATLATRNGNRRNDGLRTDPVYFRLFSGNRRHCRFRMPHDYWSNRYILCWNFQRRFSFGASKPSLGKPDPARP